MILLIVIGVAVALVIAASIGDGSSSSPAATGHAGVVTGTSGKGGNPANESADGNGNAVVSKVPEIRGAGLPAVTVLLGGGVALIAARRGTGKSGASAARASDPDGL